MKKLEVRYLKDLKNLLYDKEWSKTTSNFKIYSMYRGVRKKGELRYDITIIPPRMLGKEFVKTKGHYHRGTFGELYKVLGGKAIFLIQRGEERIEDVYYQKAKGGEYILIPPHYGHVTINPSTKILKISNWISSKCESDYKFIEKKRGACYYYTVFGWVKNKNYKRVPRLKDKKSLRKMPENLDLLYGKK